MPVVQADPVGHVRPHDPQLLGSVARFTHVPPHTTSPAAQVAAQDPARHGWLTGHARPHAPQ